MQYIIAGIYANQSCGNNSCLQQRLEIIESTQGKVHVQIPRNIIIIDILLKLHILRSEA